MQCCAGCPRLDLDGTLKGRNNNYSGALKLKLYEGTYTVWNRMQLVASNMQKYHLFVDVIQKVRNNAKSVEYRKHSHDQTRLKVLDVCLHPCGGVLLEVGSEFVLS